VKQTLQIRTVGIVLRPSTPELKSLFYEVKRNFERHGAEIAVEAVSAGMIGVLGQDFDTLCARSDLLVCIGGDGTLISLARRSYTWHKPILGINAGTLGFLANLIREIFTVLLYPLVISRIPKELAVSMGGATTMDTTLPIMTKFGGSDVALIAFVHGFVLTAMVPFVVPFILQF
jgi:NAD kinase